MTFLLRVTLCVALGASLGVQLPGCVRVGTGNTANTVPGPAAAARPIADAARDDGPIRTEPSTGSTAGSSRGSERGGRPPSEPAGDDVERGTASWYGEAHHGKTTASGEPFDMYAMTAAHPSLEMGTRVEVENLGNGRTVIVRINDRGPYSDGRIIDVSMAAAQALGFAAAGTAEVEVRLLR